jgi:hypothetical protein
MRRFLAMLCALAPGACEPAFAQSYIAPVTGSIASATNGASFTPVAGRAFSITISGTWSGSWQIERELGGVWYPLTVTVAGATTQLEQGAANASEIWLEAEPNVPYRINMSSTVTGGGWSSGTLNYRFDQ